VGRLYAVNTFGAVTGVGLAGYGLLPALGNRSTLWIAAAANVTVGLLALAYSWNLPPSTPDRARQAVPPPPTPTATSLGLGRLLITAALAVSGAVSMIYEVAWTRALALVIGSSTYAFTAMLAAFLAGIAGGAAVYAMRWGNRAVSRATFGLIQGG